ncbi:MAG: general secretion pathway protein GspK [Beijerinckiaceae bacterium]|nr:MAG: general secretion pathway protein GspK [Beijerinckiaceae bacterium]CAJ01534.1 putative general secretory pathway protein K [uncultured bacterium]
MFKNAPAADGFIIVAVLWILVALAALASVYAVFVANTAMTARVYDSRLETEALIAAGLELTAYRLLGFDDASRPTSGAFDFQLGRSHVGVAFRSEGARIDLNFAPKALLSGLCGVLGAKPGDADSYADRIIAWRTKPPRGNNPEADAYKDAGLNYGPRQAPFQNAAELRLVRGLPAALVDNALPFVTVFNGRAEIDVNEAAPEVVAALPNINSNVVDEILQQRDPQNPQKVLSLLGTAASSVAVGGRKATRAALHIMLDTGRKVNADAVLLIGDNNSPEPYRILAWRDDFDGPI